MNGLDRLVQHSSFPFPGSRVGLLCHHASITREGRHLTAVAAENPGWQVNCIFTPEHGFSGDAAPGEHVDHSLHPSLGIPIYSLYGETRSPKPEWVSELDLIVVDLKDLGVRCYTYASTLLYMMQLCSKMEISMLILDRGTPLQGVIDGPDLDKKFESFVGAVPLPLVYGKSQGELGTFLKGHLPELESLSLDVFSASNMVEDIWTPPSPAIVSAHAAVCYPATVWCEAIPDIWVDRGGESSFQVWAMPDFPQIDLNAYQGFGFQVVKKEFDTPSGHWKGIHLLQRTASPCKPVCLAHQLLKDIVSQHGPERLFECEGSRPEFFDQLAGTSAWRECLSAGTDPDFFRSAG